MRGPLHHQESYPAKRIHQIIAGFGKAAVLAKQAGFDMVQVHGDRMCGSFSSAIFNHRTDEYGGSAERRCLLCMLPRSDAMR